MKFVWWSVAVVVMFGGCRGTAGMPKEWHGFRGGPLHPGSVRASGGIQEPRQVWEFDTGGAVESSPTVVDGALYVGTFANHLFALDAMDGEERWRFPVGGLVRASPSVAYGLVYFGADDDTFYAVDAKTGEERWRVSLGKGGEQSSPAIVNGVCYFGSF
ncbi:MAG: outer membrane protein assembly factor BamB, partial [Hyphomicrobiaceae bacterium]